MTIKTSNRQKIGNVFFLYDSLRLFYANGGGDCYIVSTGIYESAGKLAGDFTAPGTDPPKGIDALVKVDEPTILVFPDNSLLTTGADFYTVYTAALSQCEALKDRVGLFHLKEDDAKGTAFRSGTGINNLKYGMAYTPWLEVNFPKKIQYRDFKDVIFKGSSKFKLADLTDDAAIQTLVSGYEQVMADVDKVTAASTALANPQQTLRERFTKLEGIYQGTKTPTNFMALVNFLFEVARKVDGLVGSGSDAVGDAELKTSLKNLIASTLLGVYTTLIAYDKELAANVSNNKYTVLFSTGTHPPTASDWGNPNIFADATVPAATDIIPATGSDAVKMDSVLPLFRKLFDQINSAWLGGVVAAAQELETKKHDGLTGSFPLYKTILTGIQNTNTSLPPSGAVAGIYAYVDRTRGVWKAPANVSLSSIIGPKDTFTASELDALNVDPNSGKSINAIRSFTGKGTLVWGARTLAGQRQRMALRQRPPLLQLRGRVAPKRPPSSSSSSRTMPIPGCTCRP